MKNYVLVFLAFLSITFTSQESIAMPPLPTSCPYTSLIKNVPFSQAFDFMGYFVASVDFFGTDSVWMFIIGPITAQSEADAMTQGGEVVQNLSGTPIPEYEGNNLVCNYNLPAPYTAIAQYAGDQMPLRTRIPPITVVF